MSKMRLVIMSALLMLLLVACGGSAPEPATEEAEPTQVQEAEPTAVPEEEAEPTAEPVEEEPEPTAEPVEEEPEPTAEPAEEEDASDEGAAEGEKVTLTIESWRNDDLAIWQDTIIPAFNAEYPNIEVLFAPTAPTEYDGVLNTKLEGGTAGDLITCRPFDRSLALFDAGHLASLNELDGLGNFGDVAKSAWVTDDGGDVFCMPMASVIHGFIYNADIFAELGLSEPTTEAEFYALLDAIKADGSYTALDMGTADQWEAATMGFQNIGPNYWKGEAGRLALIDGSAKFTDPEYVAVWEQLAKWGPYLADGYQAQSYPDSQNLFTLGQAAIYPAGSWDISLFNQEGDFELGAFPPPVPEGADTCYISDHTDIALGMNSNTPNAEQAKIFLDWMGSAEFADLYSNALPGFFSLSDHSVSISDPVAQEFVDWRQDCESTIRNSYQILSRGEPNLENELWRVSAQVINGDISAEEAASEIQSGLEGWYEPAAGAMSEESGSEAASDSGEKVTLTIESWRNDDLAIWQDTIIPAFNAEYPNIEVLFAPTAPTEYDGVLNTKLEGGTAGDLITCRPFDRSLALFDAGHLASLNELDGLGNFGDVAKSAWVTDDGGDVFCMPMASVIHGFIYNADIFTELGLSEPTTEAEFYALLDAIKADGSYTALDMGTADQWEAATMGFQNIGPNYWNGEAGRLGLIDGSAKFTDPEYVAVWEQLAKWGPYLADGYQAQSYPDSQNLFTLGLAAIYPAGSWDISLFNQEGDFELGAFPPPVPEGADTCYISDHTDIALGMNSNTPNAAEAKIFLDWMGSAEFADLYSNALPGFFSLSDHSVSISDPVAQEFVDWRQDCESTIRNSYQILSRGEPNLENELWRVSAQVINGDISAEEAASEIQSGLEGWYEPAAGAMSEESGSEATSDSGEKVTLTIESWRNDDLAIWQDTIIPAFNAEYPNIEVLFAPTAPTEYDGVLNTKLEGGTAGDLITCRPFDRSLALFDAGHLASLNELDGLGNFGDVAKSAWVTDDGGDVFCMPMASVIHGFIYNADIFTELGLSEPTTEAEFYALLEAIKADGSYTALDMGTADQWEAATMGFQNIGPNYWNGEAGRLGLIDGSAKFTDPEYVAVWEQLAKWGPYLADGYQAQSYPDSQNLFTLGQAAIYPAGSWDISLFNQEGDFELGAFPPPVPEGADTCYISDHTDIALGINSNTPNAEQAKIFLDWVGSAEFADLYSNALPGFFSLSDHSVSISDPVAQEFVDWRQDCESTIRNSYQILSRGEPNLENELWRVSAQVINGDISAEEAASEIQTGLEGWYEPAAGAMSEESGSEAASDSGEKVTLTIESWRNDDLAIWQDTIIPAFNAEYPNIEVLFAPTAPTEYDGVLNTKLEGGTAGDLITCRPFDRSLALFDAGHLASLNELDGLGNFGDVAKSAWVTDDGGDVFCMPMASVIHGFIYNADIFAELGLSEPTTEAEFYALLDAIKADGSYTALDMGTADQWEAATMGFQNIGPNYWNGEAGRLGLIDGSAKFTDPEYVAVWEQLAKWGPYLADGYQAQSYPDSQNLFTLGLAAIYPAGSWDISLFNQEGDFELGAFPPPVPEGADTCYISDHTDIALGINSNTPNAEQAKIFLDWVGSAEFADLYSNALPGFFSLSDHSVSISDPVAQEFVDWRQDCDSTIRNSYQILSRGEPNLENELWRVSAQVINGDISAEEAASEIQTGLEAWYEPAQ